MAKAYSGSWLSSAKRGLVRKMTPRSIPSTSNASTMQLGS